jgi:hypothetical protein
MSLVPGTLYNPKQSNIPWSQPGGPGTLVYPQQQINVAWGPPNGYPVPGQFFIESSGLFVSGCGHWMDAPRIFIDSGLAVVCCALCSYIQYTMPQAQFYDCVQTPITII